MLKPLIIAHRGDSSQGLENSLEAFRLALSLPVDLIELDVRMSKDGALYVMHDKKSGRTAIQDIDLERTPARTIAGIKLRNGEHIPALSEVLQLAEGKAGINIEVKSDRAGIYLARHLAGRHYHGTIIISSFKESEVLSVRKVLPHLPCAVIYDTFSPRLIDDYMRKGYRLISLRKNTVTEQLVNACRERGLGLFVWTVDDEEEMKRCIDWQVDGIYTNKPGLLKELLERRRAS